MNQISNEIETRNKLWQVGAAPLLGIGDIEVDEGWINICWEELRQLKGYPDRNK